MKWSWFGRAAMALMSALALGLSMTACGGGTIAYLWTVGQQYNQIAGFKVDDYTGNLTAVQGQPFSSGGVNPVYLVVKPGGRYLYVINQGSAYTSSSNSCGTSSSSGAASSSTCDGVAVFSVGGDGTLTYQESYETQGFGHLWAAFDSTGQYLFVLDKYSPKYQGDPTKPSYDANGAITTFAADASTGRLNLVTQNASTLPGQAAPTYVEVGSNPLQMTSSGGCLFTVNQSNQSITPYSVANGQLATVTTGNFFPGTTQMTSINGNAQYMFITDAQKGSGPGLIFSYTVGSGCTLTSFTGGAQANDKSATNPSYTLIDASGKYVFVLNQSTANTGTTSIYSSITAFSIQSGTLQETSLYKAGSGPVCMVEDPTAKYMYVSNHNDGTITGYDFSATQGTLGDLARGSTFAATNEAECLAISGAVQ